mmetsp:Transcript_27265/g.76601  ORF Transcript_27265/g.76601 Transcript_27265/m.76601 type:complete len:206 (+) Transcript_27265:17-634(+)
MQTWHRPPWLSHWQQRTHTVHGASKMRRNTEAEAARSSAMAAKIQLAGQATCASTSPISLHSSRPSQLRAAGVHTSAALSRCSGGGDGADGGRHGRRLLRRHGPQWVLLWRRRRREVTPCGTHCTSSGPVGAHAFRLKDFLPGSPHGRGGGAEGWESTNAAEDLANQGLKATSADELRTSRAAKTPLRSSTSSGGEGPARLMIAA